MCAVHHLLVCTDHEIQIQIQIQFKSFIGLSIVKYMYMIITMLCNPIHSQAYVNIEITHNIIILSLQIRL